MSLYENLDGLITLTAGADLSLKQYFLVKLNGSGQVVLGTAGDPVIGVLYDKPTSGVVCAVKPLDGRKAIGSASGAISKGALLACDANGQLKAATLGATTSSNVIGIAIESASALNDIIQFLALPFGAVPTTNA